MPQMLRDTNGGTVRLSKKRLTEVTGGASTTRWFGLLTDLHRAIQDYKLQAAPGTWYIQALSDGRHGGVIVNTDTHEIGCRRFSAATFNKIARAAKAAK